MFVKGNVVPGIWPGKNFRAFKSTACFPQWPLFTKMLQELRHDFFYWSDLLRCELKRLSELRFKIEGFLEFFRISGEAEHGLIHRLDF
jgi:hypothetical protein